MNRVRKSRKMTNSTTDSIANLRKMMRDIFKLDMEKKAIDKKLKPLNSELKESVDIDNPITTTATIDGEKFHLISEWVKRSRASVDMKELHKLIGDQGIAEVASVTQKAITDRFGNDVLQKCLIIESVDSFGGVKVVKK